MVFLLVLDGARCSLHCACVVLLLALCVMRPSSIIRKYSPSSSTTQLRFAEQISCAVEYYVPPHLQLRALTRPKLAPHVSRS
jgi:hypothetical protein